MIVELHFARTDDASLIAEVKSYLITVKDIKYLRERQWINDEVINVFGKLLFGMAKKKCVYIGCVFYVGVTSLQERERQQQLGKA